MALFKILNGSKVKLLDKIKITSTGYGYGGGNGSGLSANLLAFYRLEDTSDSSGNNNTLTTNGGVSFSSGKIGNAAVFDGSNYLETNVAGFRGDFAFACWVKRTSGGDIQHIVGMTGGPSLSFREDNSIGGWSGSEVFQASTVSSEDTWYHVVLMSDLTNGLRLYINGTLEYTGDPVTLLQPGTHVFYLGAEIVSYNLTGQLDAVGVWARALTLGEISSLYNSGAGYEI